MCEGGGGGGEPLRFTFSVKSDIFNNYIPRARVGFEMIEIANEARSTHLAIAISIIQQGRVE